jgi:hypothetical protein
MVDAETGAQMIDQQLRNEAVNLVFAGYELNMRWLIARRIAHPTPSRKRTHLDHSSTPRAGLPVEYCQNREFLMTPLPSLAKWERTSHSLHDAAMLLGAIRQLANPRVPNYLELAVSVERTGLSTDTLPGDGVVLLDFVCAAMTYTPKAGVPVSIPLAGQSQVSLLEALLIAMDTRSERLLARPDDQWSFTQALLMRIATSGLPFHHKPGELTSDAPLTIDSGASAEYAQALYRVFSAATRFRARLTGPQTPIVVWPEHFDLSTLWLSTDDRLDTASSMNFGFAPFVAAGERPYLYAYGLPHGGRI